MCIRDRGNTAGLPKNRQPCPSRQLFVWVSDDACGPCNCAYVVGNGHLRGPRTMLVSAQCQLTTNAATCMRYSRHFLLVDQRSWMSGARQCLLRAWSLSCHSKSAVPGDPPRPVPVRPNAHRGKRWCRTYSRFSVVVLSTEVPRGLGVARNGH